MPILFKPEFVPLILDGTKTQTRRIWKHGPRVKKGKIYQARTTTYGPPFATLKVKRIWRQQLGDMTINEVWAEGFADYESFLAAFAEINGIGSRWIRYSRSGNRRVSTGLYRVQPPKLRDIEVWAIEFEVVEVKKWEQKQ